MFYYRMRVCAAFCHVLSMKTFACVRKLFSLAAGAQSVFKMTTPTHVERTKHAARGDVSGVIVEAVSQVSPTVRGFTLRAENSRLTFKPGQWVDLHTPSVSTVGGYSITTPPHLLRENGVFSLAIQHSDHPPTLWMTTQCREGDRLSVQVGGDFFYDSTQSQSHDLLLVGGGVGINPLISMLLHHSKLVEEGKTTGRVKLLYSAKTRTELLFKDVIDQLSSVHSSWLSVQYFVTGQQLATPSQSDSNTNIAQRRMDKTDLSSNLSSLSLGSVTSYVCGPPPMIDSITRWLADCGVHNGHIHIEKWW